MANNPLWKSLSVLSRIPICGAVDPFPFPGIVKQYRRDQLGPDLRAGLNVALLAFPQGIAYALIAGLPVAYGIFGSAVAALLGAFFAREHFIMLGPTNATAVMLLSAFASLGLPVEERVVVLPLIVCLAGVFLLIGAFLRLSTFIQYISRTVVIGYVSAAALLIMANQIRGAFGFRFTEEETASTLVDVLYYTTRHLAETEVLAVGVSLVTLMVYLGVSRYLKKLPNVAVTLTIMGFFGYWARSAGWDLEFLESVTVSDFGLTLPPVNLDLISAIAGSALAIALLSVLEGASIGKSLAARTGARLDIDQAMYNMGVANLGCGLFSGMPASGSLTRSVLSVNSGASSPIASLAAGLFVAIGAVLIGGFVQYIPKAALAVVIITIGVSLFSVRNIRLVLKATPDDRTVFLTTIIVGMIQPLDSAIYVGTGLAIALFLRKAARPELVEYDFDAEGKLAAKREDAERSVDEVSIVHVEGDLFFGASELFRDQMRRICGEPNLRIVVLRMKNVRLLDATSVFALFELVRYMNEMDRLMVVSGVREEIFAVFEASGLLDEIGRDNVFREDAVNPTLSTAKAMRRAQELIGDGEAKVSIYVDPAKAGEQLN